MKMKILGTLLLVSVGFKAQASGLVSVGAFDVPVGSTMKGPAMPGQSFEFVVEAKPGQLLNFTSMYGTSNDWFFSAPGGLRLSPMNRPAAETVNLTDGVQIIDAGTEADENQVGAVNTGPTQKAPDQGPADPVRYVRTLNCFADFKASNFIQLTAQPLGDNRFKITLKVNENSKTPLSPGVFWVSDNSPHAYRPYVLNQAPLNNGLEAQAEAGNNEPLLQTLQNMINR